MILVWLGILKETLLLTCLVEYHHGRRQDFRQLTADESG
jgi:hypothetical protein